jgi:nitrate reductase assembly molybdenum cofactor insertion protein NarJ
MNPYRYYSLVFSYPTEESLRQIKELGETGDFSALHSCGVLHAVPLEKAQAEYTRLFISAYPALLCPPYESYYREGIVYGQASVEVGELYERHGLKFSFEGEPPDLLSAELDFLALTNDRSFLARVKEWVFEFTGRVKEHSKLYDVCADELETLLNSDIANDKAGMPKSP